MCRDSRDIDYPLSWDRASDFLLEIRQQTEIERYSGRYILWRFGVIITNDDPGALLVELLSFLSFFSVKGFSLYFYNNSESERVYDEQLLQAGIVIVFVSSVTVPLRAIRRPFIVAPVVKVIDVNATIVPVEAGRCSQGGRRSHPEKYVACLCSLNQSDTLKPDAVLTSIR